MGATRLQLENRWGALMSERSSWMTQWMEVSTYLLPANGRFFVQDRNKGNKRFNSIYDSTATKALRTLAAGLMAGATSPARPWFRLHTSNPGLDTQQDVKVWLSQVSDIMHQVFQQSNAYRALQQTYEELGAFGTSAVVVLPDFDNVIHCYPLTAGEYCIAQDAKGNVTTLYRRFQMTVGQLVKEFGLAACTGTVQAMYHTGTQLDQWITVQHSLEPRYDRDPAKADAKNMAWGSYYHEVGANESLFLRESGFKRFPALCPRWSVTGGDIYGVSPAMESLGDIKGLQHKQLRKAQGIDYQTNPPLLVPVNMKNRDLDRLPGGVSYADAQGPTSAVKNLFEVNLDLQWLIHDIQQDQQRINSTFFADLFLMISNNTDPNMTATEVSARQEEKMLMLGPVFERLSNELFAPLIKITFDAMMEGNAVPPAPQSLQGAQIGVQYLSVLAQAQKSINTNATDRFVQSMGMVAQMKPDVMDKFNEDAWANTYSEELGLDPSLIVADDKVQALRQSRAQAQQAQQQAALQEQQSKTAKNLGQTPTAGPANAAMDMMNQFSGYGTSVQ